MRNNNVIVTTVMIFDNDIVVGGVKKLVVEVSTLHGVRGVGALVELAGHYLHLNMGNMYNLFTG